MERTSKELISFFMEHVMLVMKIKFLYRMAHRGMFRICDICNGLRKPPPARSRKLYNNIILD